MCLVTWFHMLCKNVATESDLSGENRLQAESVEKSWSMVKSAERWLHFSFALIQTRSPEASVTLLCFNSTDLMLQGFDNLLQLDSWANVVNDPYLLFPMIFEVIWMEMDAVAWRLADVFRNTEKV